jgi:acyl-CoA thioester hydrolase
MVDANRHLRHSAYADFAAQARVAMLGEIGLSVSLFEQLQIGPILFREELVYLREVQLNDMVQVSCELTRARPDGSRWSVRHELFRKDGVKAAVVSVDLAWIDIKQRRLTTLPDEWTSSFLKLPRSHDYEEETPAPRRGGSTFRVNDQDLVAQFENAQDDSKTLSTQPDNENLLRLYSLYKQATQGDAPDEGPTGLFDPVGKAKREAWKQQKGISPESAMRHYIALVEELKKA